MALGQLLQEIYDRARYDLSIDYRQPPEPPLTAEDAAWADELLRAKGLRQWKLDKRKDAEAQRREGVVE
jgi:hypothetical protein